MDFLRARTKEQIEQRQLDIMKACEALFSEGGYDNVNMKAISEITAINRSSIYTYYKTKDEIILDLLREEILDWKEELKAWSESYKGTTKQDFAAAFTKHLITKDKMLQYYCILYSFLEINCRIENLVTFKKDVVPVIGVLIQVLLNAFPKYSLESASIIAEEIMTYVLGLYPSTHLTDKQKKAIEISETGYQAPDFSILCENGILSFLN